MKWQKTLLPAKIEYFLPGHGFAQRLVGGLFHFDAGNCGTKTISPVPLKNSFCGLLFDS